MIIDLSVIVLQGNMINVFIKFTNASRNFMLNDKAVLFADIVDMMTIKWIESETIDSHGSARVSLD